MLAAALFLGIAGAAFAEGPVFSGTLDSAVSMGAGAGEEDGFFYGLEEYANLRMQARLREGATFYGALNIIATARVFAEAAAALAHAAVLEPERLYFSLNGDYLDFSGGLMRIAFGYGQVWGPSDFLNPKNPLLPDARPRAVLGSSLAIYPGDTVKLALFGAAPENPLNGGGEGFITGLSAERHGERVSTQGLYAFETPRTGSPYGFHRAGLSIKADLELGLVADLLYAWNPRNIPGIDGLSISAGFDYSFYRGKFYCLAEYLYSGAAPVLAAPP